MPSASLAAPPGQWTPAAPAVTAPPGSWHARPPSWRMPHRMPNPGQPGLFGYPPQAVAPPARADRAQCTSSSPATSHRRKQAELGRPPSIAGGEREIVPAGQGTADVKSRKLLQLKFAQLKFLLQLCPHRRQTLCLHRLLNGMREPCLS